MDTHARSLCCTFRAEGGDTALSHRAGLRTEYTVGGLTLVSIKDHYLAIYLGRECKAEQSPPPGRARVGEGLLPIPTRCLFVLFVVSSVGFLKFLPRAWKMNLKRNI